MMTRLTHAIVARVAPLGDLSGPMRSEAIQTAAESLGLTLPISWPPHPSETPQDLSGLARAYAREYLGEHFIADLPGLSE